MSETHNQLDAYASAFENPHMSEAGRLLALKVSPDTKPRL